MSINRGQEEPSQDEAISTSDLWKYSDLYRLSWTYIHVIGCFCSVDQGAHEKANKNCEEVEVELWIFGWIFTMAFFVQQAMLQPLATSPPHI